MPFILVPREETLPAGGQHEVERAGKGHYMHTIRVQLSERGYDIAVTSDDAAGLGSFARQRAQSSRAFLVTDEHVIEHAEKVAASLREASFDPLVVSLPSGEAQKSLAI